MKSNEIRQLFIDFFTEKGHTHRTGSSLIPADDPSLLFTNAGMVQFKSIFLGKEDPVFKRAVTVQKCLRAGGKHNDLENVGKTARHHTFFEMLGNFSFGDYFKEEAIVWAWEFLTRRLKLSPEKLWITVYEKDDEAVHLWRTKVGISSERIIRLGEKDNFWQMAETGPCGSCSEILYDQGSEVSCGRAACAVGCDCDRYLELWNLVFMEFNKDKEGNLSPLPKPSIDTGMGIERLASVLQGKHTNFESDLFMPLITKVEDISGHYYGKEEKFDTAMKVIADHVRASAFVLSEGLVPSNEGRGYVLRRIIRRAARYGYILGIENPFLFLLINTVAEIMGSAYKELSEHSTVIQKVLESEEKRFIHTLSYGMSIVDDLLARLESASTHIIPGNELFKLYDTYGFPVDIVDDIAQERGFSLDYEGFNQAMKEQKDKARASWTGSAESEKGIYSEIAKKYGATEFVGYEYDETQSTVLALIKDSTLINHADEGDEIEIVFDKTPCYGEAGGQIGDKGSAFGEHTELDIIDTYRHNGLFAHKAAVKKGTLNIHEKVHIVIDSKRRAAIMRNHTATHLLHTALKQILGDHVKQAGSLVAPDRLRFDFNHFSAVTEEEIADIERLVNEKIIENIPVHVSIMSLDKALSGGVVALFGEKYGEEVRVVKSGDFSAELCGGTHCKATGDIGPFHIINEGSVAAGIRRIEAITGYQALDYMKETLLTVRTVESLLKVKRDDLVEKVQSLQREVKKLKKEVEKARDQSLKGGIESVFDSAIEIKGIKVLTKRMDGLDMKSLRSSADKLRDLIRSGVFVLASVSDGKVFYVAGVTKDLTERFKAGDILKEITKGKGGGRPDMAQGGSNDVDYVDEALQEVMRIVERCGEF
jgi:alanyl-tRNA synthetase